MPNPFATLIQEVRAAFAQPEQGWLDGLANALVEMSGNGFDPQACTLPAFKPRQEPRAALPKKEKRVADLTNDDLLTDEEMRDWRYHGSDASNIKHIKNITSDARKSKAIEVDLDEMPDDMHGITEREYGEMKAYNPPLNNLKLASDVKRMKPTKTLKEIAQILGETEQTIRHYSSALYKASPIK